MSNRAAFYDIVRDELDSLKQSQVDGYEILLNKWDDLHLQDPRHLAYLLATVFHETNRTISPIKELGGLKYLKSKPYYPYYGRGFCQLTWRANYARHGIADDPDKALEPKTAADIIFSDMESGAFTGKKLSDYFSATKNDPVNARRIINGTDRAQLIAGYYHHFLNAVTAMNKPEPEAQQVKA